VLHADMLQELLTDEVKVARDRLGNRIVDLSIANFNVYCRLVVPGAGEFRLRLAGRSYDAEPFRVSVVNDRDEIQPPHLWPKGLYNGQHLSLGVPFACVRGTFEYHVHPSHLTDVWERYRHKIRLADLLDHLVRRCDR